MAVTTALKTSAQETQLDESLKAKQSSQATATAQHKAQEQYTRTLTIKERECLAFGALPIAKPEHAGLPAASARQQTPMQELREAARQYRRAAVLSALLGGFALLSALLLPATFFGLLAMSAFTGLGLSLGFGFAAKKKRDAIAVREREITYSESGSRSSESSASASASQSSSVEQSRRFRHWAAESDLKIKQKPDAPAASESYNPPAAPPYPVAPYDESPAPIYTPAPYEPSPSDQHGDDPFRAKPNAGSEQNKEADHVTPPC